MNLKEYQKTAADLHARLMVEAVKKQANIDAANAKIREAEDMIAKAERQKLRAYSNFRTGEEVYYEAMDSLIVEYENQKQEVES